MVETNLAGDGGPCCSYIIYLDFYDRSMQNTGPIGRNQLGPHLAQ